MVVRSTNDHGLAFEDLYHIGCCALSVEVVTPRFVKYIMGIFEAGVSLPTIASVDQAK